MKIKILPLLVALALLTAFGAGTAHAQFDWCASCAQTPTCFDCCMCDHHNGPLCYRVCGDVLVSGDQGAASDLLAAELLACPADDSQRLPADAGPALELDRARVAPFLSGV